MSLSKNSLPRPEYPRPQFVREDWQNLNGEWEFEFDDSNLGLQHNWQDGRELPRRITVPFAYQSELSGINDKGIHEVVWYARDFEKPTQWPGKEILLNFGAVDYRTTLWINGKEVGHNQGGNVPFSFEITPYLQDGKNRITIRVEDYQDPHQPRGKQSSSGIPREIDYYCTTGIWQTVWLEPVPKMRIQNFTITPNIESEVFHLTVFLHAPSIGWEVKATVLAEGKEISTITKNTNAAVSHISIPVSNPELWSPENPFLYDIEISLYGDGKKLDTVYSYAGMRKISLSNNRVLLNNNPLYLAMVLDQGYWPKGGLTAPTDEDLKKDVELTKEYGFNGSRKHQKVEDPRWLYWCDKLGLLVWGEMANARAWTPKAEEWLIAEWERAVQRDYNHPCIIAWVPMNESWGVPGLRENHPGQYAYLERVVTATRKIDNYRPVIDNDGWEHTDITDICAIHDYTPDAEGIRKRYRETLETGKLPPIVWSANIPLFARGSEHHGQPVILTEVGGFLMIPPDLPESEQDILYNFYGSCRTSEEMLDKYKDLMSGIEELSFIAGFCYTQLVDVEHEINGLLTYDRLPKIDPKEIATINQKLISNYIVKNS